MEWDVLCSDDARKGVVPPYSYSLLSLSSANQPIMRQLSENATPKKKEREKKPTIITLQKINTPVELTPTLPLPNAHPKVETTITPSSIPYILLRPNTSANHPNTTCPMTIPALVLAFNAVLTVAGNAPFEEEDDEGSVQKTIPRKVVMRFMAKMEYESRKKPVPATRTARMSEGC